MAWDYRLRSSEDLQRVHFFSRPSTLISQRTLPSLSLGGFPVPASPGLPSHRPGPPPGLLPDPQLTGAEAEMGFPGCTKLHSRAKLSVTDVL